MKGRGLFCALLFGPCVFGQNSASPPKFEMADVHVSPPTVHAAEGGPMHEGRYALYHATMLDLIAAAWGVRSDKIADGPSWLNVDKFDVIGQAAPTTSPAAMPMMLRTLLADRFELKTHEDKRPLPAFVLTAGKHPLLKASEDSENAGCRWRYLTAERKAASKPVFACHSVSMDEFAAKLAGLDAGYVDAPVANETSLAGKWDFSFFWTNKWQRIASGEGLTLFEAVEKQLGLKLEPRDVSMDMIVVDSVNRKPTDNPPGVAEKLSPPSREFEVASVRTSEPGEEPRSDFESGGRIILRAGMLSSILRGAWDIRSSDMVTGAPDWLGEDKFDVVAKMPAPLQAAGPGRVPVDLPALEQMWRSLLRDRFGMVWHYEDRSANVFAMVPDKPKLKKADPLIRSDCRLLTVDKGGRPEWAWECRNISMDELTARMNQQVAFELSHPVINSTGLEGGWDFTITWTPASQTASSGPSGNDSAQAAGSAPDPTGAISFAEALDKELGLKLEVQKHVIPVLVIDHINRQPTDN